MSDPLTLGPEHIAAQLAASIAFADTGALPSRIQLFADAALGGAMLAEIVLAKPCAALASGKLALYPASATPLVTVSGVPVSARWLNGAGLLVASGSVTDLEHDGAFRVGGGATAPGNASPTLYAGGVVLLGDLVFDDLA